MKQEMVDISYGFDAVQSSLLEESQNETFNSEEQKLITWGVKCFLPNCNTSKRNTPRARFFRFPKHNRELFQRWMVACGYKSLPERCNRYLCHKHFEPTCFGKRRLKADSVPTLNMPTFEVLRDFEETESKTHVPETECLVELMVHETELVAEYSDNEVRTQPEITLHKKPEPQDRRDIPEKMEKQEFSEHLLEELSNIPPDERETGEAICCACIENRERVESLRQKYDALLEKYKNLRKMHEKYQKFYYYATQNNKDSVSDNKFQVHNHNKGDSAKQKQKTNNRTSSLKVAMPKVKKFKNSISSRTPSTLQTQHRGGNGHEEKENDATQAPSLVPSLKRGETEDHQQHEEDSTETPSLVPSHEHEEYQAPQDEDDSRYTPPLNYSSDHSSSMADTLKRSCTKTIEYKFGESTTSDDSDESFLPSAERRKSSSKKYKKSTW